MAKYITGGILGTFLCLLMFSVFIGCGSNDDNDDDRPAAVGYIYGDGNKPYEQSTLITPGHRDT